MHILFLIIKIRFKHSLNIFKNNLIFIFNKKMKTTYYVDFLTNRYFFYFNNIIKLYYINF